MKPSNKVTGIGGIFFQCDDPDEVKKWYQHHLGLDTNEYGAMFRFRKAEDPNQAAYLQWSTMKKNDPYFSPSKKEFMINYRVENLEDLVKELKEEGVNVLDEIESYSYGKFVHLLDPEGNKIELWEPVDEVFSAMETDDDADKH